ncbi:MAG: pyridoxamine 5'-phosphate oxidase family protein [Nitrospiraceae bacterium]|jgi:predicted pyridoxine 5'-phosphate oxidase superfamily flavin-nucleotide-binding protein|nr:pyridoxamine 5'-phosphate oxidase family protein [Nitrospiraceae bacterium]OQW66007.1 MAG: pyridoxamine 5'-phosphate oxidase [Nitrospira sp. ST-bin5]ULA65522.1 MAG: Flavodoxin reductases (ferredoxin-NADPH reductases) family 1 [Nitrospira sp.]
MTGKYLQMMMTESVRAAQRRYYRRALMIADAPDHDPLGEAEVRFIADRDSFYLGSVGETGWPYIQHRGGPKGFLKVLDPFTLAFVDYRGNRQLLSTGNFNANGRVALFLMDYKNRSRLKILGRVRVEDIREHPALAEQLAQRDIQVKVERIILIEVLSFDWNCSKHITPRYSLDEVEEAIAPLRTRIAELEAQLASLRT